MDALGRVGWIGGCLVGAILFGGVTNAMNGTEVISLYQSAVHGIIAYLLLDACLRK